MHEISLPLRKEGSSQMSVGTMTSKGQITVPKDVREALGLAAGTRVSFKRNAAGEIVLTRDGGSVMDRAGSLRHDSPAVSLQDMNDAIAAGATSTSS